MTKRAPTASPLALAAILAASAFPATIASAQEAATPPVTVPDPAPAPVIVLPPDDAAPAAPAPAPIVLPETTAQPAPEPAASPSARAAQRSAAPAATRTTSNRATESSPAVAAPASGTEATVPPALVTDAAPVSAVDPGTAAVPVADAAPPAAPEQDTGWLIPLALGGIALGGGIAYAATSGKRRRKIQPADPVAYREARNEVRAPVREPVATSALASTIPATAMPLPDARVEETPTARRTFQEPVRMPSGPIPTGTERQALIERMVAAAPDASNPFHSRKTRRKRARILLAAAEHRQRTAATEPFDFRKYESFSQQEASRNGTATVRERESVN